jgi:adenosine deaminase
LRRRIILAVILLAAFIVLLRVAVLAGEFDTVITAATFEAARENRTTLRAFLHRMPKGGDLHTHLGGAVYAERFIAWAAQQELCVDPQKVVVPKPQCDRAGVVRASDAMRDQQLYNQLVDAFSMRAFLPTPAVPTGHDEFFAAFEKFGEVSGSHFVDMTIDQLRRYDSENVQYVEFMVSSSCRDDRDRFVKAISETTDDASKLKALEASGLGDCVAARRNDLTAAIGKIRTALACDARNTQPGCGVTFRYIVQVNRNNSPDEVFVQTAIAAALIRAEPRMVALNFVGPKTTGGAPRLHPPHADHPFSRQRRAGGAARGRAVARARSAARPYLPHPRGHRDRWRPPHRPRRRACLRTRDGRPACRDARAAGRRGGLPHQH